MCPQRDTRRRRRVGKRGDDAVLIVEGGPNHGATIALSPGTTTLGRQTDRDVVLDDAAASREHVLIVASDGDYHLRDLSSTNGTFLNRHRIGEGDHPLKHGDVLYFGASSISFRFHHARASTLQLPTVEPPPDAIVVDAKARHVYILGQILEPPIARKEFDLLALLDSRRGEAISRDEIASYVWPERTDGDVGNHEIEQCVRRVRVRVEDDPSNPKHVVTMRGFGYKLN